MVCKLKDHLAAYQACDTKKTIYQQLGELGVQVSTLLLRQLRNNLSHCMDIHQNGVGGKPLIGYLPADDGSALLVWHQVFLSYIHIGHVSHHVTAPSDTKWV